MSITNKWEEEEYLSRGAYSEVFRVRLHGKDYALKKIFPHLLKEPIHRESVEREIKILESIDHPKIIKFYQTIV
jgi:serine/threonine protein kinase